MNGSDTKHEMSENTYQDWEYHLQKKLNDQDATTDHKHGKNQHTFVKYAAKPDVKEHEHTANSGQEQQETSRIHTYTDHEIIGQNYDDLTGDHVGSECEDEGDIGADITRIQHAIRPKVWAQAKALSAPL